MLAITTKKKFHLAILKKRYIQAILSGQKTMESRFSKTRKPPYNCINTGDTIYLKQSAGAVLATATAGQVVQFENLTPDKIQQISQNYNHEILAEADYYIQKQHSRYATLIQLLNVRPIDPRKINKKDWHAWTILTRQRNFSLPLE